MISDKDWVNTNCVGMLRQKSWIFMSLKWPCLTTASQISSCCSYGTFEQISRRQERLILAQRFSILVRWYMAKRYVNLACCLLRWEVRSHHIYTTLFWVQVHTFPVNELSQQKRAMRHGIRKLQKLKSRHYAAHIIDLNDYLYAFPREQRQVTKLVKQNLMKLF